MKILKGEILTVTGAVNTGAVNSQGSIWWTGQGKQSVLAASFESGEVVTLGPYVNDASFDVSMRTGSYFIQKIGDQGNVVPVPLADYLESGSGGSGVTGEGISSIVKITRENFDNLPVKNPETAYLILPSSGV